MADSLLPIVFLAALSIPFEMRGVTGAVCIPIAILWCAPPPASELRLISAHAAVLMSLT